MKVCSYCGTEYPDNVVKCESCGAHEFKHICNNCGTVFTDGMYCPQCGVKAGQKPRVCPNCGHQYFSNACPTCGYVKENKERVASKGERPITRSESHPVRPEKKRRTWLWVLGWIFIFPIPLTVLLLRKKNMKPVLKYGIIAAAWGVYLFFGATGNSDTNSNNNIAGTLPSSSVITESENILLGDIQPSESASNADEMDNSLQYAQDVIVNRFITEFNNTYNDNIIDISKGNIRTKYYGQIRSTRLEMINANDATAGAFSISIYGGREESDREAMFESFREIVKILEPALTDDKISTVINELVTGNTLVEKYPLGSTMLITYVPTKELSYGKNGCRVDIYAYDYKEAPSVTTSVAVPIEPTETPLVEAPVAVATEPIEMDSLQELFVSLSPSTTKAEIDAYITENGLVTHAFSFDSGYYIGYESSAVRQRGRDRVGPAVDVSFVTSGDSELIGTVKSAEYTVHTESNTHYALKYKDGIFYYEGNACASGYEAMQKYLTANQ